MSEIETPKCGQAFVGDPSVGLPPELETWQDAHDFCVRLEKQLAAASEEITKLKAKMDFTYCAYCGKEFPIEPKDDTKAVSEHIATCPVHPMREVEKQLAEANQELAKVKRTCAEDVSEAQEEIDRLKACVMRRRMRPTLCSR